MSVFFQRAPSRVSSLILPLLMLLLAGCGGGGGDGGGSTSAASVSGYVAKGPVAGATVSVYSVAPDGARTLLSTTTSDSNGAYRFDIVPPAGTVLLVEATGGSYVDEMSGLSSGGATLRALAVGNGADLRVTVTPLTEVAVLEVESTAPPPDWSAASVAAATAMVADSTGLPGFAQFVPIDLRSPGQIAAASDDDFFGSLVLGAFAGMQHRLGGSGGPAPLSDALSALRAALKDPYDDLYNPLLLLGFVDFIDLTALAPDAKRGLKGSLLLDNSFASDADIAAALPSGLPTGNASAPMPDNTLEVVPDLNIVREWPVGTLFNSRGALYAYGISANFGTYKYLYSGNVAELYGDGEVGIGRWRGGVMFDALDGAGLEQLASPQILAPDNGVVYAVALPATELPACGVRTLPHVASTAPTQTAGLGFKPVTGLTADSAISVQYTGNGALVAFDIGLRFTDNSTVRVVSTGGISAPWASGIQTDGNRAFNFSITPAAAPPQLPGLRLDANGILAGTGGRKVSAKLRIYSTQVDAMTLAAAFSGPNTVDTGGCATGAPGDGSTIDPPLADGTYWTLAGTDSTDSLYRGVPLLATISPSGSLLTAGHSGQLPQLSIPAATPTFELFGNAYAAIGRARGPFTLRGNAHDRSLPFAVAQAATTLPTTGIRSYVMVAASAAIAVTQVGGVITELPAGHVSAATVDVNFGESPWGTASPFYGSVRYSISGSVSGASFEFSTPIGSGGQPVDAVYYRDSGTFSDFGVEGALSGPNGEFMILRFHRAIGSAPVQGVLLLQAE